MFIKEIELNNFRIYKGKNNIALSPEGFKNIIIVSGKNGYGKTTFLMSLVWCLYGKNMEKVDELYEREIKEKGNYTKYISDSLNRQAYDEGKSEFSVSIVFADVKIPDITCNEIKITRTYNIYGTTNENVEVLIDGYQNELIQDLTKENQRGEEIFIRDFILPIEIAKFFFFDAEKIVSLAQVNSSHERRQLSRAYSEVLGIQKYEDLKSSLDEKLDDYRRKSAKKEDKEELITVQAELESVSLEIETLYSQLDYLKEKKNLKDIESEEIQRKLIRDGDKMSVEELQKLKEEYNKLELAKNNILEKLKELFDLLPLALCGENLLGISEQCGIEKLVAEQSYNQQEVTAKINRIRQEIENHKLNLNFPIDIRTRDFYEEQIIYLVKKYFITDSIEIPENIKVLHDFSNIELNEFNQLMITLRHNFKESFERFNTEYTFIKNSMDVINRKIRDAEKCAEDDYIASLREKKLAIDDRIRELETVIESTVLKFGELNNRLKTLKQKQEILRAKIDFSSQYSKKAEKTKVLITKVQNFITVFKEEKKKSLEEKMLNGLNTLLHKKNFIDKVVVDISISGEDIDISLYSPNGKVIDKSSLSMGERQMYASALLHALVDESNIEFPVFIDSPMQKFDEKHAENIIKYFYPSVSNQVVLFPLINKELTEKEYKLLEANICKAYLINNLSITHSEFVITTPENFLMTYKTYSDDSQHKN